MKTEQFNVSLTHLLERRRIIEDVGKAFNQQDNTLSKHSTATLQLSSTVALGRAALAFSMFQWADSRKAVSGAPVKWDGAFLCADSLQQIACLSLLGRACWGPFAPALLASNFPQDQMALSFTATVEKNGGGGFAIGGRREVRRKICASEHEDNHQPRSTLMYSSHGGSFMLMRLVARC